MQSKLTPEIIKKMSKQEWQVLYDDDYMRYERLMPDFQTRLKHIPYRFKWFARYIPERSRVLDVGCGDGLLCAYLASLGHKCLGIDCSQKAIEVCRENVPNADFIQLFVEDMDFKEEFDAVCCSEVIEHLKDPKLAVKKMWKATKHVLLITTPIGYALNCPLHLNHFGLYEIVDLFEGLTDNFMICRIPKAVEGGTKNLFAIRAYKR